MKRNSSLQEGLDAIDRIKLLMKYKTSQTLNENIKNIFREQTEDQQNTNNNEKQEKKTNNSRYSDEEIAQVFKGNSIKTPDGLFDTYVDANIEITQLFTDKTTMDSFSGGFKNSNGSSWSDEKLREFLHVPSVAFFIDGDGRMMQSFFTQDKKNANNNKLYNGWRFGGYKVYKQGGEGSKDVIYDKKKPLRTFDPNKDSYDETPAKIKLIVPDKNIYLKNGELKYTISSDTKNDRLVKIERVEVLPPVGMRPDDWREINCTDRPACTKPHVAVKSYTTAEIKPGWKGFVILSVDETGFGYNGTTSQALTFDYSLRITTSEGEIYTTLRGGETDKFESRMMQRVRMSTEKGFERVNPKLGVKVPDNFSPFCYDKFLSELYEVIKDGSKNVCMDSGKGDVWEKYISYDQKLVDKYPFPVGAGSEPTQACQKLINSVVKKYYDKNFPTGICPEQKEIFKNQSNTIEQEIAEIEKRGQRANRAGESRFDESSLNEKDRKRYKELKKQLGELRTEYGFDDRNAFEKFWEDYGLWIQGGLALLSLVATFGGTSWAAVATLADLADIYMNAAVGTYYALKGDTKEAILGFFFAALPKIHKLYGKVGELFGDPSVAVTKSLANRIAQVEFRTVQEMEAFAQALPAAERGLFYNALKLKPGDFQEAFRLVEEDLTKMASSGAAKFAKGTAKFVAKAGTDFFIIHNLEQLYNEVITRIKKYCPDCLTTEEQRAAKTFLDGLSPSQQKSVQQYLNLIENSNYSEETKSQMMADVAANKTVYLAAGKKLMGDVAKESFGQNFDSKNAAKILREHYESKIAIKKIKMVSSIDNKEYTLTKDEFLKYVKELDVPEGKYEYSYNDSEVLKAFQGKLFRPDEKNKNIFYTRDDLYVK